MTLLPDLRVRVLASAKTGHVTPCIGIARALGVEPEIAPVRPRRLFHALAPFGPADPRDNSTAAPYPDIAIASARETVPSLRKLKRVSGGSVFTVYLGDPRTSHDVFDLVWTPEHDSVVGGNIVKTLTAPHPHSANALAAARAVGDPRLDPLQSPRVACLVGGPSGQYAFGPADIERLCAAVSAIAAQGASVMLSASRRTPPEAIERIRRELDRSGAAQRCFIWDGSGPNPYVAMLATADALLVTSDSVNMVGEALATGKPVHVLRLEGKPGKFARFYEQLIARGLVREWDGTLGQWSYEAVDATADIAGEVARRFTVFSAARGNAV